MKVVVGLGNPGPEYAGTRHNVGFDVVEQVARELQVPLERAPGPSLRGGRRWKDLDIVLVCPMTFMNRSGEALRAFGFVAEPAPGQTGPAFGDLLIVYDDVDLDVGRVLLRERGSDGGHRGLRSIIDVLGTPEIPRLRIGVGRGKDGTVDHVLGRPEAEEAVQVQKAVAEAARAVVTWLDSASTQIAMNQVNRRPRPDGEPEAPAGDA